ncbi:unnamed protein product [Pedinophyceae sp. YPF-701]|nr:unnamed protein product [Pedinophyceae sp. YPF-701]
MLGAGFCHLLGEADREMGHRNYPVPELLAAVGFLITLLADQVVSAYSSDMGSCESLTTIVRRVRPPTQPIPTGPDQAASNPLAMRAIQEVTNGLGAQCAPDHDGHHKRDSGPDSGSASPTHHTPQHPHGRPARRDEHARVAGGSSRSWHEQEREQDPGTSGRKAPNVPLLPVGAPRSNAPAYTYESVPGVDGLDGTRYRAGADAQAAAANGHAGAGAAHKRPRGVMATESDYDTEETSPRPSVSFATALILAVALSIHSVLEGAAMGAQRTVEQSVDVFIAIVAHKGLASYALGSSLVESGTRLTRFAAVTWFFAAATPLGIFMGFVLSEVASTGLSAGITALAAGTFIYVAVMEVIPKELRTRKHKTAKVAMLLAGFSIMAVVAYWV